MGSSADFPGSSSEEFKHRTIRTERTTYVLTEGSTEPGSHSGQNVLGITDLSEGICYASAALASGSDYILRDPLEDMSKDAYNDLVNEFSPQSVWAVEETRTEDLEEMKKLVLRHEDPMRVLETEDEPVLVANKSNMYY